MNTMVKHIHKILIVPPCPASSNISSNNLTETPPWWWSYEYFALPSLFASSSDHRRQFVASHTSCLIWVNLSINCWMLSDSNADKIYISEALHTIFPTQSEIATWMLSILLHTKIQFEQSLPVSKYINAIHRHIYSMDDNCSQITRNNPISMYS